MSPKHTAAANQAVGQSPQHTDVPGSPTTTSLAAPPPAYWTLNDPNARTNPCAPSAIPLRDMPPSQPQGASGYNSSGIAGFGVSNVSGFGHDIGPAYAQYYGNQMCLEGKHAFRKNYGIVGIIFAVVCFPCGLIGLCIDNEEVCTRCGLRV